ncbi:MAG: GHKL domain-containing protein [Bacteroidetes bacterium]|nr:GHKL domain-containing protein [Bacteroidota bacterium]
MNLRTRITLAMLSLVVLSIIVIGVVTVWFFQEQNSDYHQQRLQRKERSIKTEMRYFSKEVKLQEDMDIVLREFEEVLVRLASVHNLQINFFNTAGQLLLTAQPDSVTQPVVAQQQIPAQSLAELQEKDRVIIPTRTDGQEYLSDYTNLYNGQGEQIAILNIPYVQDPEISQQDLEEFLGSIGLVYISIALGAIGLTIVLSNSITKNISILSERLGNLDLNKKNEPIQWSSDDEIGTLVATYNIMLEKLEESRVQLAKTERESAWREMARQVAHEIKNPLTPIKLSVQHLQATAAHDDPEWQSKLQDTLKMIIQQIDALSNIATEFSDFAKMPRAKASRVNVSSVVKDMALLFRDAPFELGVEIQSPDAEILIDEDQLHRLLNNLVKNAKHAVSQQTNPKVEVSVTSGSNKVGICISDNGEGIPAEAKEKIFRPNSTTKSSGTGLGLSISKQIVEQANGEIWFESDEGGPTKFYVSFPTA